MIDTLATFADQVTTVAREVGVEGKLGGQAKVPGAAGTWKGLTENVNQLAANLTTQVRAIAEVATAVTQGDLTRSITVEARGEVAALKDTTNEMIRNLRDTTRKNTEQDWLKTNLAKFSRMLQGQKDLNTVGRLILSELAPVVAAQHAVFYVLDSTARAVAADAAGELRRERPGRDRQPAGDGRGAGRPMRDREAEDPALQGAARLHHDLLRPRRGAAAEHSRSAGRLRRSGQGGAGAGLVRAIQPDARSLSRPAHGKHRHRHQHDRGQHAHRGPAHAIAVARAGTAEPAAGAPADESGTGGKGGTARPSEPGGRAQEPGGRAGPQGARGEGRAARAHVEVQVRVPGEHVARAPDAAQQPADPVRPAVPERGGQPDDEAGRVFRRRSTRRATTC